MKKFFYYLNLFLNEVIKERRNKLYIDPLSIAAIVQGAATIGTKIVSDIKAKKLAAKADVQAQKERAINERKSKEAIQITRGTAREGDPTLAETQRKIQESVANTVGRVKATTGSTQEVIKAVQTTQEAADKATIASQSQAGQFKINLKEHLASRFGEAGRLRLAGQVGIDRRLQSAVDAIGAGAQANVDTVQNIGKLGIDALAFSKGISNQRVRATV